MKDEAATRQRAGALIAWGMALMVLGLMWPYIPYSVNHMSSSLNDFVRGSLMGVAIGIEILGFATGGMSRRGCRGLGMSK